MTDPTPKTLPQDVRDRALAAIAKIHIWNSAVTMARALEALAGCPGKYEYDLIASTNPAWTGMRLGGHTLDTLEHEFRAQGWSPDDFYAALGQPRPALIPENPQIWQWRKGDR